MIDILMAVYNGKDYIREQLDSITAQTAANWKLFISDDGSTDGTYEILKEYQSYYPERIVLHRFDKNSGSADRNFFKLISMVEHNYIMFCDHDDVWHPRKIEQTYRKMLEIESVEKNKPLLVHTDAKVVDENLDVINSSLFKMQNLNPKADKLNNLLVQNIVTGCTMMVNKALIDMLKPIPQYDVMHDWWFALIACCFGKIEFLPKKTILYRQHGDNQVGAKNFRSLGYKIYRFFDKERTKKVLNDTYKQAEEFLSIYGPLLNVNQKKIIKAYVKIPTLNKFQRIGTLFKYNFFKYGFSRKVGQFLFT